jgi:energy-coupling factor transport system ATP-binding protein
MILFENMSVTYPDQDRPALRGVELKIGEGELALVIGPTGAGKSTLLRAVNGLVPHFSGGRLTGRVLVDGRSTAEHRPRDLADVVGFVGQDPDATFVADIVEDELAYSMENLGLSAPTMRRRVEDVLDILNLHPLRQRAIMSLSGGQRQRVAIGAVLTAAPRLLVLDEPTSSLDPISAEEVLAALSRLVHDQGVTIVVAEHRLERIVHAADVIVHVPGSTGTVRLGTPAEILATSSVAPPIVRLAQTAGWDPLPLSVRDARRLAPGLRRLLPAAPDGTGRDSPTRGPVVAAVRRLSARYGRLLALENITLDLYGGEVTAVMGRNGAGKSTLLRHLVGLRAPEQGSVTVAGRKPAELRPAAAARIVGLVPQDPASMLSADSVAAECGDADHDASLGPGSTRSALERLMPGLAEATHPRDLSEGQRLALALAIVLAPAPPLILLDEPTRGLDYGAKARLTEMLRRLARDGHSVVVATHDVELVADTADRVLVLADGELITDGPTRDVVCHSPGLAPQVARILAPDPWLTVAEVASGLARARSVAPEPAP